ncbi:integrase-like protein [Rhodobacter viridis]|uniref:Integrase-like protein n=1 Tax=Rhodobacter viridis TaxID=1054202 RepID=A0A318TTP8_9RHOB|nr:DDE-type integrase/transposase/recombinase [Rhodobacter viridis]PYF08152.1 integrase-like protein [Rhodobacter viridis]
MTTSVARVVNLEDLIFIGTTQYCIDEVNEAGLWLETLSEPRLRKFLDFAALEKLRLSPDYRVIKRYFAPLHRREGKPAAGSILTRLDNDETEKLNAHVEMTEWLLAKERAGEMSRSDDSMKAQLPALKAHMDLCARAGRKKNYRTKRTVFDVPSLKTLRKMMNAYTEAGNDLLALAPKKVTRPSERRLDLTVAKILRTVVRTEYQSRQRPSGNSVLLAVEKAIDDENARRRQCGQDQLEYPCLRTIYREIDKLDPLETYANRHGEKAAKSKFKITDTGLMVTRPLERVEIDEVKLDVLSIAIDSGIAAKMTVEQLRELERTRRWAVVAIDIATRCILGIVVTPAPSREATLRVMEQTTRDKSDIAAAYGCQNDWCQGGRWELSVMDNGTGFVPQRIRMAAAAMQASVMFTEAGEPSQRGTIERFFRTVGTKVMPLLPGRTFSNTQERGDYPSAETACLTDDELTRILVKWIVDCYHHEPHFGLGGETPAHAWARLTAKYPLVDDLSGYERREAFGRRFRRQVTGRGIILFGIEYASELTAHIHLHEKNDVLDCRVDEHNLGWISVLWDGEWHPLKAKWDFFDGIHLADWQETLAVMRAQNKLLARESRRTVKAALNSVRAIVDAAKTRCNVGPDSLNSKTLIRIEKEITRSMSHIDQNPEATEAADGATLGALFEDDFDDLLRIAPCEVAADAATPPASANGNNDGRTEDNDDDYVEISE